MKNKSYFILISFLLLFVQIGKSQVFHDTAFKKTGDVGFFFGPTVDASDIALDIRLFYGGQAAFSYGNIAIGTFGVHSPAKGITDNNNNSFEMSLSYGGPWMAYRPIVEFPLHPYFGFKTAWGTAAVEKKNSIIGGREKYDIHILQPEFGMEIIAGKHIHIICTGGYKWINKLEKTRLLKAEDSQSMLLSLSVQFGWF